MKQVDVKQPPLRGFVLDNNNKKPKPIIYDIQMIKDIYITDSPKTQKPNIINDLGDSPGKTSPDIIISGPIVQPKVNTISYDFDDPKFDGIKAIPVPKQITPGISYNFDDPKFDGVGESPKSDGGKVQNIHSTEISYNFNDPKFILDDEDLSGSDIIPICGTQLPAETTANLISITTHPSVSFSEEEDDDIFLTNPTVQKPAPQNQKISYDVTDQKFSVVQFSDSNDEVYLNNPVPDFSDKSDTKFINISCYEFSDCADESIYAG